MGKSRDHTLEAVAAERLARLLYLLDARRKGADARHLVRLNHVLISRDNGHMVMMTYFECLFGVLDGEPGGRKVEEDGVGGAFEAETVNAGVAV